jgi:hypothetical protein
MMNIMDLEASDDNDLVYVIVMSDIDEDDNHQLDEDLLNI